MKCHIGKSEDFFRFIFDYVAMRRQGMANDTDASVAFLAVFP
jgi:hypothetical protein